MLSICNLKNADQAATYYEKDNYYTREESPSRWFGKTAAALGLSGAVDRRTLNNLLHGRLSDGTEVGVKGKHLPGIDLTFSAPKSVSLMCLLEDERILKAHKDAVGEALAWMENTSAQARMTEKGVTREEDTGNLCIARFDHDTSRELDPQLHTHAVVLNVTRREDGNYRALHNVKLYRNKMAAGAIYRAALADRLVALGYEIETTAPDGRFEIKGFTKEQLGHFSQRRAQIEKELREKGFDTAAAAAAASLNTRKAKADVDRSLLMKSWRERARSMNLKLEIPGEKSNRLRKGRENRTQAAERVVAMAVDHFSERRSVFKQTDLVRFALQKGVGYTTLSQVEQEISSIRGRGGLLDVGEGRFTTERALGLEQRIIGAARRGKGVCESIYSKSDLDKFFEKSTFTLGQREAAELILTTGDRVVGIQGYAGTGKTYALKTVREFAEEAGYQVRGFAPTAAAASLLSEDAGIESRTIAKLLASREEKTDRRQLWVVDETSMVGTESGAKLLERAERAGARVVLVGDRNQLPAIEAGKPFALLMDRKDIDVSVMSEILRQKDEGLKKSVRMIIAGRDREALKELETNVFEYEERSDRLKAVAAEYLDDTEGHMMITGTNRDRRALNDLVREGLKDRGDLQGPAAESEILVSKSPTKAELRDTSLYQEDDVVVFGRDYKRLGVEKGARAVVVSVDRDLNTIRLRDDKPSTSEDGNPQTTRAAGKRGNHRAREFDWKPFRNSKVELFSSQTRELQAGDLIRWTRNDRENERNNGDLARVLSVDPGKGTARVETAAEKRGGSQALDLDSQKHWEHGYASTIYAAQGKTVDEILIHVDTSQKAVMGHEAWYVAVTRARRGAKVFTDHPDNVPEAISRIMLQESAIEAREKFVKEAKKDEKERSVRKGRIPSRDL